MPEFPGGQQALMQYLSKNIKYPVESQEKREQGRVIVRFIVEKDGSISDIEIIRKVSPALDKEAERIIAAMPKWTPGKQRGQAVNVYYTVPVSFRLTGMDNSKVKVDSSNVAVVGYGNQTLQAEEIKNPDLSEVVVVGYGSQEALKEEPTFKVAEKMPKFPGGENALFQYFAKSIKYPIIAQKNKEQGKVILKVIIGKDGSISNIKVDKSVSPSLDAEAVRMVSAMPKWEAGEQGGQAVNVEYTLPITFRLQNQ